METVHSKRIDEIDIIKAFAIIGMVWGHIGLPGKQFIYLFHMAVFFICSGIVCKEKYSESMTGLVKFTKNKIRSLYVPYVFCAILFTLLNNTFLRIGFYAPEECPYLCWKRIVIDCLRALLFVRGTQLSGATWFLHALFFISEVHAVGNFLLCHFKVEKKCLVQSVVSCLMLFCLFVLKSHLLNHKALYEYVSHFVLGYFAYCIGVNITDFKILSKLKDTTLSVRAVVFLLSLAVLLFGSRIGSGISIASGNFQNPFYFFAMSLSGFFMLFCIALLVEHIVFAKAAFVFLGKNTLPVVLWHLLAFKFMNAFYVFLFCLDKSLVSAYPTFYGQMQERRFIIGGGYLCIGLILPVLLHLSRTKITALWRKRHD